MAQPPHTDNERRLAVDLFNGVWDLIETPVRSQVDDDRMVHMAHASRHHWGNVVAAAQGASAEGSASAVNLVRGEWQCSRVYAVLGRAEPCLHHARRVLQLCAEHGIADWDLAFGYEALARGLALAGDAAGAEAALAQARSAAADIVEDDDRQAVLADLETIPR